MTSQFHAGSPIHAAVLGPLEVRAAGHLVPLRSSKTRRLLSALLMDRNRPGDVDRLTEAVWPSGAPPTHRKSLANQVMRLRHALGEDDTILWDRSGYTIDPAHWVVDATDFERLAADARVALDRGDPHGAHRCAERALHLWRARPFPDLEDLPRAAAEVARLEEIEEGAREVRALSLLQLGRAEDVLAATVVLTEENPYRERGWWLRAVALYRTHRRREAALVLDDARRVLADAGLEPGRELRTLEQMVLSDDPALLRVDLRPEVEVIAPHPPRVVSAPFVGREDALAALAARLPPARAGRDEGSRRDEGAGTGVRAALLVGGAGLGKSRLLREFVERCLSGQDVVVEVHQHELYGSPLAALAAGIGALATTPAAAAPLASTTIGSDLAGFAPELMGTGVRVVEAPEILPENRAHRLAAGISALLCSLASRCRLVVIVDDAHWCTPEVVGVLQRLVDDRVPATLILAMRDSEAPTDALERFLDAGHLSGWLERVELTGLSSAEISDYLEKRFGQPDTQLAVAEELRRCTEGNPFFLEELTDAAHAADELRWHDGMWHLHTPPSVPPRPQGVLDLRLGGLDVAARQVLDTLAIFGEPLPVQILSAVVADAPGGLAAAERAGMIRVTDGGGGANRAASIRHDLIRHHLDDRAGEAARMELRSCLADALAADDPLRWTQQIAALHVASAALDPQRAVHSARRAAESALGEYSVRQAADLLAAARVVAAEHGLLTTELELELTIEEGDLRRRIGDSRHRELLLHAAQVADEDHDVESMGLAALAICGVGATSAVGWFDEEAADLAERTLARMPVADSPTRALLLGAASHLHSNSPVRHRSIGLYTEAERMARALRDPQILAEVLAHSYWVESGVEDMDERERRGEELIRLGTTCGPRAEWAGQRIRFSVALQRNRPADTLEAHTVMSDLLHELGDPLDEAVVECQEGTLAFIRGDLEAMRTAATRCHEASLRCGLAPSRTEAVLGAQLMMEAWLDDRIVALAPVVEPLVESQPGIPAWQMVMALIDAERGDSDATAERVGAMVVDDFAMFPTDHFWSVAVMGVGLAAARAGLADPSRLVHERLAPHWGRMSWAGSATLGLIDQVLGETAACFGDLDTAEHHFKVAMRIAQWWESPTFASFADLGLGQVALARHRIDSATEHLRRAATVAGGHELALIRNRATDLLAGSG